MRIHNRNKTLSKKQILRVRGDRWCRLEVTLTAKGEEGKPVFSMTMAEGVIMSEAAAEKAAIDSWESFFMDDKAEAASMLERFEDKMLEKLQGPERPGLARAAALVVVAIDGRFHGLDVEPGSPPCVPVLPDEDDETREGRSPENYVMVLESCGQLGDAVLEEWFPEAAPYTQYHLNDMHSACEHQEALGWHTKKVVSLMREMCTPVQLAILDTAILKTDPTYEAALSRAERHLRELLHVSVYEMQQSGAVHPQLRAFEAAMCTQYEAAKAAVQGDRKRSLARLHPNDIVCFVRRYATNDDAKVAADKAFDGILAMRPSWTGLLQRSRDVLAGLVDQWIVEQSAASVPKPQFEVQSWEHGIGAPCPVCGYRLGHAWLYRVLPAEVIAWVESLPE